MPSKRPSSYVYPSSRIAVFGREPILGQVKTRLEPELGLKGCLALYRAMLSHTLVTVRDSGLAPLELWVSSNIAHELFLKYCYKREIYLQKGEDLGQKMAYAACKNLNSPSIDSLIIIGSDCPVMKREYIAMGLQALHCSSDPVDVVLGPTLDGGYALIGLKKPQAGVFQDIEWGTVHVMEQTLERMAAESLKYHLLEPLWDVDRPQDLERLESLDALLDTYLSV